MWAIFSAIFSHFLSNQTIEEILFFFNFSFISLQVQFFIHCEGPKSLSLPNSSLTPNRTNPKKCEEEATAGDRRTNSDRTPTRKRTAAETQQER